MMEHQDLTLSWSTGQNWLKRKNPFSLGHIALYSYLWIIPYSRKLLLNEKCSWEYFSTGYYLRLEFKKQFYYILPMSSIFIVAMREEAELTVDSWPPNMWIQFPHVNSSVPNGNQCRRTENHQYYCKTKFKRLTF